MSEKEQPPLPENLERAFAGPAVFSNRIYATLSPLGIRLTFMESSPNGEEQYRTAAYLSILDGIALKDLLERQLGNVQVAVEPKQEEG